MFDFAEEWRRQFKVRRAPDGAAEWDRRAREESTKFGPSAYSQEFLDRAGLLPGETIFDMGCGAGALAIPAAARGHAVLACDFSPAMLARLEAGIPADQRGLIRTQRLSWEDDWSAAGVAPRSFDVACASRSIITPDLADSLAKLSTVARRRACVTVTAGSSPRAFGQLFSDLGLAGRGHQDAAFVFGVLTQQGYEPQVGFIRSERHDRFATRAQAFDAYARMLDFTAEPLTSAARRTALADLEGWLDAHLVSQPAEGQGTDGVRVDVPRRFSWAFISWEV